MSLQPLLQGRGGRCCLQQLCPARDTNSREKYRTKGALASSNNNSVLFGAFGRVYGQTISGESGEERTCLGSNRGLQTSNSPATAITTTYSDSSRLQDSRDTNNTQVGGKTIPQGNPNEKPFTFSPLTYHLQSIHFLSP